MRTSAHSRWRSAVVGDRRGGSTGVTARRRLLAMTLVAAFAVAGFGSAALLSPTAAIAAPGDPFDPSVGRVFVAQDDPTRLYSAVQGAGAISFQPEGAVSGIGYNAIGYNTTDNYLYGLRRDDGSRTVLLRIGQGGVVTSLGAVSGLIAPPVGEVFNQGTFGSGATAHVLYVRGSQASSNQLWAINTTTRAATAITLSAAVPNLSDLVWKDGFLWGMFSNDAMYRIDPTTGQVASWATGLGLNTAYGAQWVYGNGNIGLSANTTGTIYQVSIANPTSAAPTFALLSTTTGPASANNDGTAVAGIDVDLGIVKTGPAVYAPGAAITYTLTVTNHGPGVSSGFQVTDPLPGVITGGSSPTAGCVVTTGTLRCALAGLTVGATKTITVNGTVAAGTTGLLTNTARVIGNERDPNPANDLSTTTAAFSAGFRCTADVVYGVTSTVTTAAILGINRTTGATVQEGVFATGLPIMLNGLGISADGRYAFAVSQSGSKLVYRYDTTTGTSNLAGTIPEAAAATLYMGAVNPSNGLYYVGANDGSQQVFYAFDTATNTSLGERFRLPAPITGSTYSDLTFDSQGRAYISSSSGNGTPTGNRLLVIETLPTDGSVATTRPLANLEPSTAGFQGMAFGSDGYLYTQHIGVSNRVLTRIDPNSGAAVSNAIIQNPNGTTNTTVNDLASCSLPGTITAQKNIADRHTAGDQFTVTITGNGVAMGNSGTTSGTSTGLQGSPAASAGPVVGVPGRTYTITETPSGGTLPANYRSSWECRNASAGGAVIADGNGTSGTVTMPPATQPGSHIVCVFTNIPIPTWTIVKQAFRGIDALDAGSTVQPGDEITYRVTATNTSATPVTAVVLTDDLSDVLDDAVFVAGSAQLAITAGAAVPVADPAGNVLKAGPFVLPPSATATLTYRVTVRDDAWSSTLRNVATAAGGTPGEPTPPQPCPTDCTTTQITPSPVQIQKVGEASTGSVVPMDGSQWAIFGAATGGIALVDPLSPALSGGAPVTGLFRDVTLTAGTYWLEETRALGGFALLSQRIPFTVAPSGDVTLGITAGTNVTMVDLDGVATIRVEDVPALDLPDAGGPGVAGIYLIGISLVVSGALAGAFIIVRQRRRASVDIHEPHA